MALPINETPIYTLELPSTKGKLKYRPFLIKEEKALLIAQQSEDPVVMVDTLKEVIKSCIKDEVDVDAFATFDLEYVFTQIRAKSVGEIIELKLRCDDCTDEKAVGTAFIDLTKLKVYISEDHTNKISLYDDVGIVMKYPTIDVLKTMDVLDSNDLDQVFDVITDCIDYIFTSKEVFYAKEQTKEELLEFLNNLTSEQFENVQKFFETMPRLKQEIEYTCPVCNKKHNKVLEGLQSFF
jgi:ribosomal protein L44E